MSPEEQVEALAAVLGDIRVAGARQEDWWTNDDDHRLLIRVLKAECIPWAKGLVDSDFLTSVRRDAAAEALREAAAAIEPLWAGHFSPAPWLRDRADLLAGEGS